MMPVRLVAENPYAVARYYGVPLWSKEHFDAMRPIIILTSKN